MVIYGYFVAYSENSILMRDKCFFCFLAIMHLYYARFFNHFLYDNGFVTTKEPFKKLLTQGMVLGKTYKKKGQESNYLKPEEITFKGKSIDIMQIVQMCCFIIFR